MSFNIQNLNLCAAVVLASSNLFTMEIKEESNYKNFDKNNFLNDLNNINVRLKLRKP